VPVCNPCATKTDMTVTLSSHNSGLVIETSTQTMANRLRSYMRNRGITGPPAQVIASVVADGYWHGDSTYIIETTYARIAKAQECTKRTAQNRIKAIKNMGLDWIEVRSFNWGLEVELYLSEWKTCGKPSEKEAKNRTAPQVEKGVKNDGKADMAQPVQRVRAVAGDTYPDSSNKLEEEEEVTRTHTHEKTHTTQPTTSAFLNTDFSIQEEHTLERELADAIQGHGFDALNRWGVRTIVKGLRSWAGEDDDAAMAFVVSKLTYLQERGETSKSVLVTALTNDGEAWQARNPRYAPPLDVESTWTPVIVSDEEEDEEIEKLRAMPALSDQEMFERIMGMMKAGGDQ